MRFNKIYVGNARCSIPNRRGTRAIKGSCYGTILFGLLPNLYPTHIRITGRSTYYLNHLGTRIVIANTKSKISRYIRE